MENHPSLFPRSLRSVIFTSEVTKLCVFACASARASLARWSWISPSDTASFALSTSVCATPCRTRAASSRAKSILFASSVNSASFTSSSARSSFRTACARASFAASSTGVSSAFSLAVASWPSREVGLLIVAPSDAWSDGAEGAGASAGAPVVELCPFCPADRDTPTLTTNTAIASAPAGQLLREPESKSRHLLQRADVCHSLGRSDRDLVAANLALHAHLAGEPPDRRVVEQQRFDKPLDEVDPRIEPADMGQFVGDDGIKHVRRHAGEQRRGQNHHRP